MGELVRERVRGMEEEEEEEERQLVERGLGQVWGKQCLTRLPTGGPRTAVLAAL